MRAPSFAQATPHGESPTTIVESTACVRVFTSVTASPSKRVTTASESAGLQTGLASARATRQVPPVHVSPPLHGSPSSQSASRVHGTGSVVVVGTGTVVEELDDVEVVDDSGGAVDDDVVVVVATVLVVGSSVVVVVGIEGDVVLDVVWTVVDVVCTVVEEELVDVELVVVGCSVLVELVDDVDVELVVGTGDVVLVEDVLVEEVVD